MQARSEDRDVPEPQHFNLPGMSKPHHQTENPQVKTSTNDSSDEFSDEFDIPAFLRQNK